MASGGATKRSQLRGLRPLSASPSTVISYDMLIIGHGAGGQQKSHFIRSPTDAKIRGNSVKQQSSITTRPSTSRKITRPAAQTPKLAITSRPRSSIPSIKTPTPLKIQTRNQPSNKTNTPITRDINRPSFAPVVRPSTAIAISAIMLGKLSQQPKQPKPSLQSKQEQVSLTPSPSETPTCVSLQVSSNVDQNSCTNQQASDSKLETVQDGPSYKGLDALLLQLEKTLNQSEPEESKPLRSTSRAICGGVSSDSAKGETLTANTQLDLALDLDLQPQQTREEDIAAPIRKPQDVPICNTPRARSITPVDRSRCRTPQSITRRSFGMSSRLHLVRQSTCTRPSSDDTLINVEEVEHGYQLLLLECPNEIVGTFMQGLEQFHKERHFKSFAEDRGLSLHFPIFTIVQKDHFYTYAAILKYNFQIFWSWRTRLDDEFYDALLPNQLVNHFSNITLITRKDTLWKSYQVLRTFTSAVSKALPETFLLPNDYGKLKVLFGNRGDARDPDRLDQIFIVKPLALSRGRHINLVRDPQEIEYSVPSLVQLYISNPVLINRRKVDFRLYVGLFYNPTTCSYNAFLFKDGIARLCSREYNINNIQCLRAHLTNTSINGEHETAFLHTRMPLEQALRVISLTYNTDKKVLVPLIKKVIIVGLLAGILSANGIDGSRPSAACFELLGVDVLLSYDSKLNTPHAHLLEFNASPSLAINCPLDEEIKPRVVSTMISLALANSSGMLIEFAETMKDCVEPLIPSKQYEMLRSSMKGV